jgi:Clp amino terminal domain, pathogenicity island component
VRHEYFGTEHILLGIVSDPSGANAGALGTFSITLDRVRSGTDSAKVSLRTCGRADEGDYRDVQTETARGVTIAPAPGIDGSLC